VEVDADGAFAFPSTVADGSDYAVTVDRQPREPAQLCRVLNGRGVVRGADVSDINVVCGEGSSITVSVDRPGSDGANVEVYVYSPLPEAALVGVSARGTKLEGGRASFVVQSAQGNGAAVLPQGEYDVFVFVNHDGSVDPNTGRDTWSVADYGSRRRATLRANSDNPVNFYGSDFSLLVAPGVRAQAALSIAPDAVLSCLYAPAGAGAVALPQGEGAPVVGRAVRSCEEGESCFARPTVFDNFRAATTDENQALPRGLYDLTCFGDEDGDGEVDSGEFYGVLFGVSAGSQAITITLQEVP
jgi:hypothetical protein